MSLLWQFVAVFAVSWIGLLLTVRKPNIWKWSLMHLGTAVALLYSADRFRYFRSLPGTGLLPWMTNLRQEVFCFGAMAVFAVLFFVTVVLHIVYIPRTSYRLKFWKRHPDDGTARFPVIRHQKTV